MPSVLHCTFEGCTRQFQKRDHLDRHVRSHEGSKPFACDFEACRSAFARQDALLRHKRLHEGGRAVKQRTPYSRPTISSTAAPQHTPVQIFDTPTASTSTALDDPLALLSNTSARLDALGPFQDDVLWNASVLDDFLFQQGGETSAFLNSLISSDYYNAAPSSFTTPTFARAPLPTEGSLSDEVEPIVRIRQPEALFEEVNQLCFTRLEDFVPSPHEVHASASDERTFESVKAELAEPIDVETVSEPSSSFLATSLQHYWRYIHPMFPILHRPTFRTCDHHPLLLLTMCASGAAGMAAETFNTFAEAVFRRIVLVIFERWDTQLSLRQRHDLLFVGLLVCRHGLYSGQRDWLKRIIGLHGASLAYTRQLNVFGPGGAYRFFRSGRTVTTSADQWGHWLAHESSTRLAHAILLIDDWIHIVARDQQPPLACQVHLYFTSTDAIYNCATAEDWVVRVGPSLTEPETVSPWIKRLFEEDRVSLPVEATSSSWQQLVLSFAIYTQKRCRWMSIISAPNETLRDSFDASCLRALASWHFSIQTQPAGDNAELSDFAAMNFEALHISFTVDLDAMLTACGKEGYRSCRAAFDALYTDWWGRPVSRRALLHSGQVIRFLLQHAGSSTMPFHASPAAQYAVMIIWLYGLFDEYTRNRESTTRMPAKSFCATETYSYFSLGQIGVGLLDRVDLVPASEPLSPAANWILKGGDVHFCDDDPLSTYAGRSMTLMRIAKCLRSYTCPCTDQMAQMARVFSQVELAD